MGREKWKANKDRKAERDARREQYRGLAQNADGAEIRIGQYGEFWANLPVAEFARGLRPPLHINFAGFWEWSESGKKYEGEDPNSGYLFVMDSTMQYYRVQNSDGDYVDAEGKTIVDKKYKGDQNLFAQNSHFRNQSA